MRKMTWEALACRNLLQKKDFYAGLFMVLLGAGVTLNSTTYKLGTLMHMGPGMFPFMLGIIMMFVGALIFITGVVTPLAAGERILPESMEWRGWACILAGPLMFILFGELFRHGRRDLRLRLRVGARRPHRDLEELGDPGRRRHGRSACCCSPTSCKCRSRCSGGASNARDRASPISGTASASRSSRTT